MTHAIDVRGEPGDLELKRELLRLRFAVSRLRVQTALADLQGDALHSAPARAMAWVRAPWVRRIAFAAAACLLIGTLWRFGWRRPVRWVAQGLSLWQLARPLLHDLGFGAGQASNQAAGVQAATAGQQAQPAAP